MFQQTLIFDFRITKNQDIQFFALLKCFSFPADTNIMPGTCSCCSYTVASSATTAVFTGCWDWRLRRLLAAMENVSLPSDVLNDVTTSPSQRDDLTLYLANIRDLALKVIYIIIGTVGILDNLFVLIVFILFIKITEKVLQNTRIYTSLSTHLGRP